MADATKHTKPGRDYKPTAGSKIAAAVRAGANDLTKEERSAAYSRAMARIYDARARHAARA
jgi:hypothetical protein